MSVASLILAGSLAFGSVGEGVPQVSGVGVEKVDLLPSAMRMVLKIEAKGDTLDDALADLQKQFDDLKGKLAATSPVEGTLKMKGPELAGGGPDERMRMMQQMRQRFGRNDNTAAPEKKEGKKVVALEGTVQSEWKLTSGDVASLLRESEKIREAVTAAIPKKAAEEKKSEDEEEAALMQAAQMEQGAMPAGQPTFLFVGSVDKARLAQARQSAFAKARENAQEIAEAAGGKLGALVTVASNAANAEEVNNMDYYSMRFMRQAMGMSDRSAGQAEAVSPTLKELSFAVEVNASFALEQAK